MPTPRSTLLAAFSSGWLRAALASMTLALGACDGDQDSCTRGYEACTCAPEARCLEGLQCLSNRCVDPNATPADGEGGETGSGGSEGGTGAEFDNVSACEALLDSLECAPTGGVALIDCASFGASPCDVSDYFDCLADNTTCNGEQLDPTGWTQCMDLAVCS